MPRRGTAPNQASSCVRHRPLTMYTEFLVSRQSSPSVAMTSGDGPMPSDPAGTSVPS